MDKVNMIPLMRAVPGVPVPLEFCTKLLAGVFSLQSL